MDEKEYIEREKAFDAVFAQFCASSDETEAALNAAIEEIRAIPAADVRPVVRGKWIDMGDFISCSMCNATRLKEFESDYGKAKRLDARTNFCPNCGADMREENEDEKNKT